MKLELKYHSPSTINSFITNKASFYMRKVMNLGDFKHSPKSARGAAVEHGVNLVFEKGVNTPVAVENAILKYETLVEERGDIYNSISALTYEAIGHFLRVCPGAQTQTKINWGMEGCKLRGYGIMDYVNGECVRDCKVTGQTPSKLSQDYKIQGACYRKATGLPVFFDFIVPLKKGPQIKSIQLSNEDYEFGIQYAEAAAREMEKLMEDLTQDEVMRIMSFPNYDAFWSEEDCLAAAQAYGHDFYPKTNPVVSGDLG